MADNRNDFQERLVEKLLTSGNHATYGKGEFLIREGETEKNIFFIESGLVRVFLLNEFEEQTIRFGYQGSIINSLASFIKGTPSEFYIEALRKTSVRAISKDQLTTLIYSSEATLKSYTYLLEILITQQIEREIDLLTPSPLERLNRVLQRSPHLFQEVPLKYIASYLRMTPETLSRIRSS